MLLHNFIHFLKHGHCMYFYLTLFLKDFLDPTLDIPDDMVRRIQCSWVKSRMAFQKGAKATDLPVQYLAERKIAA